MKLYTTLAVAVAIAGCSSNGTTLTPQTAAPASAAQRHYNGTASVGDFLSLVVDATAHTIAYADRSNGESGTASYVVNADGTYTVNDPTGNLVAAYEVPGYAMVLQAAKTGPARTTPSLVTAVESGPVSLATFGNQDYNYMQFRTAAGGLEVGSVSFSGTVGTTSAYWPYGAENPGAGQNAYLTSVVPLSAAVSDPSGTSLTLTGPDGGVDHIFGTANGIFIVDTPNGSILGFQKAASAVFDPAYAGTYHAIEYVKTNATTGVGNVETGTAALGRATIVVSASGAVTVTDPSGVSSGTLTPVASVPYLVGPGELNDPCYGLFTYRSLTATTQKDVFVTFVGRAMLFSSYTGAYPTTPGAPYAYSYGAALH